MTTLAECARRIAELEAENERLRAELAVVRRSKASYEGKRLAEIARGTWQPFADAGPVRDHIRAVMAETGITANAFANVAGVNQATVGAVLDGRETIRAVSAAKLTAVTADTVRARAEDARVDAAGTRRRLQALAVQGWSLKEISRRSGADENTLSLARSGKKNIVAAKTRRAVAGVYEQMAFTEPPAGTREEKTAAGSSRAQAGRMGWLSHWAWDAGTIDDPDGKPAQDWKRAPERKNRKGAELAAEAAELFGFGLGRDAAAERLGVTRAALDKALERYAAAEASEAA